MVEELIALVKERGVRGGNTSGKVFAGVPMTTGLKIRDTVNEVLFDNRCRHFWADTIGGDFGYRHEKQMKDVIDYVAIEVVQFNDFKALVEATDEGTHFLFYRDSKHLMTLVERLCGSPREIIDWLLGTDGEVGLHYGPYNIELINESSKDVVCFGLTFQFEDPADDMQGDPDFPVDIHVPNRTYISPRDGGRYPAIGRGESTMMWSINNTYQFMKVVDQMLKDGAVIAPVRRD